jgi:hypothetical protein
MTVKRGSKRRIRIPSFGSVIGLGFNRGGFAEVLMTHPEFGGILDAWNNYEQMRSKPDKQVLAALDLLGKKVRKMNAVFVAEVPIARQHAKVTPTFGEE